jgi:hypothetical protein
LAAVHLGFHPFPLVSWSEDDISEENIFDTLEFLFDHITKRTDFSGLGITNYDESRGQREFATKASLFLKDYGVGFELSNDGTILSIGNDGLQSILNEEIIEYDETNVDSKVREAIKKWRNRELSWDLRREAIRELADVFEWLKTNKALEKINSKDDSAIFQIANKFAIRHHNQQQQANYEKEIWYPWMFHLYLATYHAAIRLLKKDKIT